MDNFTVKIDAERLQEQLRQDPILLLASARTVMLKKGTTVKNAVRRLIGRAGLGKLAKAIQRVVTKGNARSGLLDIQVRVISKAIVKRAGGVFDLVLVFGEGATIKGVAKRYLALPFDNIGRGPRGRKLTPDDFPKGFFAFVKIAKGDRAGFLKSKDEGRFMFVVLKRTHLAKRYELADALRSLADVTGDILKEWDKRLAKQAASLSKAA